MRARIITAAIAIFVSLWPQAMIAKELNVPDSAHVLVIRQFFALINEHRVGDALAMMAPELVPDANAEAAWTRQFLAIKSIRVLGMRPADIGDSGACFIYRVTLEVHLSKQAAKAPIPNYGWGANPNLRWITLCPSRGRLWRISSLGTGP